MSWIERIKSNITPTRKASIPEGVWTKCDSCGQVLYRAELERNLEVCPKCDHHMRMSARNRLHSLLDEGSLVELGSELEPKDVLKFRDSKKYKDRLASAQKETGEKDALVVMKGTLHGMPVVAAAFEFAFMGGSMGSVVGARFVRAVEQALEDNCPLVCFSASGGARMQEALMSLMQMAKNLCCAGENAGTWSALHLGIDRSDNGRRFRQFCDAGRSQHRRAKSPDWLRRPARYRTDRSRKTAARIPAQ